MTDENDIVERLREAKDDTIARYNGNRAKAVAARVMTRFDAADLIERQAAEIARLKAGGCARDQRLTQFCAEAVRLERVAQFLWSLLDDIDTASDMAKADDAFYRRRVELIQRRRFHCGSTDGYSVRFTDAPPLPTGKED